MARLSIDLPSTFLFTTEIAVRATDLNYGGHVGNDTILSYMQEIRVQFYRNLGFKSELNIVGPVGQIITDAAVVYKSESFLGDVITGSIGVADFNKYGFDYIYLLTNKATSKEVARGKTGIVCFDYNKRKVVSIPHELLAALKQ
jgi:acyl-CoA thioester hydrolase